MGIDRANRSSRDSWMLYGHGAIIQQDIPFFFLTKGHVQETQRNQNSLLDRIGKVSRGKMKNGEDEASRRRSQPNQKCGSIDRVSIGFSRKITYPFRPIY